MIAHRDDAAARLRTRRDAAGRRRRMAAHARCRTAARSPARRSALVGFGSIGRLTAKLGRAARHATSIGYDAAARRRRSGVGASSGVRRGRSPTLLADADVVSLHVPLTRRDAPPDRRRAPRRDEARRDPDQHLARRRRRRGRARRGAARRHASAARRSTCSTDEPLPAGSPLAGCPNLILTPHVAGVTRESNERVSALIARKVAARARRPLMRMPRLPPPSSTLARARARARGRDRRRWPTRRRARSSTPKRRASRSHGVVARRAVRDASAQRPRRRRARCRRSRASAAARCSSTRGDGLAFPACALAVDEAIRPCARARRRVRRASPTAIISASPPYHLRPVAAAGIVGLAFGNSPAAMPVAGGTRAAARHQSDRRGLSAPRRRAAGRSTCRCPRSRAAR